MQVTEAIKILEWYNGKLSKEDINFISRTTTVKPHFGFSSNKEFYAMLENESYEGKRTFYGRAALWLLFSECHYQYYITGKELKEMIGGPIYFVTTSIEEKNYHYVAVYPQERLIVDSLAGIFEKNISYCYLKDEYFGNIIKYPSNLTIKPWEKKGDN